MIRKPCFWIGLLLSITPLTGCQVPGLQERIDKRWKNMRNTYELIANEQGHQESMEKVLNELERHCQQDILYSRNNLAALKQRFEGEFDDWARRQPSIRQGIHDELKGNVSNIEPTLLEVLD